jgi:hypothetical protein
MLQDLVTLKREDLYQKVWSTPMFKVANELRLPWSKLKKICKIMDIPTPAKAYWNKRLKPKVLKPTPLPFSTSKTLLEYSYYPSPMKIIIAIRKTFQ